MLSRLSQICTCDLLPGLVGLGITSVWNCSRRRFIASRAQLCGRLSSMTLSMCFEVDEKHMKLEHQALGYLSTSTASAMHPLTPRIYVLTRLRSIWPALGTLATCLSSRPSSCSLQGLQNCHFQFRAPCKFSRVNHSFGN